jgi:hypothetical protein
MPSFTCVEWICRHTKGESMMHPNPADTPRGLISELRAALEAIPADEPRNYLRQSQQLLIPLLEQFHQRLQALEVRLEALESGHRRADGLPPSTGM